jgi:hypothetical protein
VIGRALVLEDQFELAQRPVPLSIFCIDLSTPSPLLIPLRGREGNGEGCISESSQGCLHSVGLTRDPRQQYALSGDTSQTDRGTFLLAARAAC